MSRSSFCWPWIGLLLVVLAAASRAADISAEGDAARFAQVPQLSLISLAPSGSVVSFVRHADARQIVVIRELERARERETLSVSVREQRIRWCDWISEQRVLCGTIREVRRPERIAQRTRLYSIDVATGEAHELNRRLDDPLRDQMLGALPSSNRILLQHDPVGMGYPEVAEIDVISGATRRVVASRPPVRRWMADPFGIVRLGIAYDAGEAALYVRGEGTDDWNALLKQSLTDVSAIGPLVLASARELLVLKHHDGRAALFSIDIGGDAIVPRLLYADPSYDVTGPVMLDPQSGAPLSVQFVREREVQHPLHDPEAHRLALLDARLPDASNIVLDRSIDGTRLLVRSSRDVDPPSFYLYDARAATLQLIGHAHPDLETSRLAPMQAITYRARDGQTIPGYLTLPLGQEAENLPAVVLPHGGPETRNWQDFDPLVQFLAAEGYAVLQMNFRGSFGYGAGFAAAGVGQWGGVIHNDITDGARWLIEQKIADPQRMCIVGQSFGGYAALLGAARESQWYACAASFAGASDLLALSQSTKRLHDADMWRQRLGDDPRALWQMSPMARVHAVETPVLLMHGRRDAVIPVSQSKRFARVMRRAGKPHRFVERADCDHEMTVESCRLAFFTELEHFLRSALR